MNKKTISALISLTVLIIVFYFFLKIRKQERTVKGETFDKEFPLIDYNDSLSVRLISLHDYPAWLRDNSYTALVSTTEGKYFIGTGAKLINGKKISEFLKSGDSLLKKQKSDTLKIVSDGEAYFVKIYTDQE